MNKEEFKNLKKDDVVICNTDAHAREYEKGGRYIVIRTVYDGFDGFNTGYVFTVDDNGIENAIHYRCFDIAHGCAPSEDEEDNVTVKNTMNACFENMENYIHDKLKKGGTVKEMKECLNNLTAIEDARSHIVKLLDSNQEQESKIDKNQKIISDLQCFVIVSQTNAMVMRESIMNSNIKRDDKEVISSIAKCEVLSEIVKILRQENKD